MNRKRNFGRRQADDWRDHQKHETGDQQIRGQPEFRRLEQRRFDTENRNSVDNRPLLAPIDREKVYTMHFKHGFLPGQSVDEYACFFMQVCPLLLRVFPKTGAHHRLEDFATRGSEPKEEIQVYTWQDATLRELCDLVQEVNDAARRPSARLSFAFIYPDRTGRNVMRQVGVVHSSRPGPDDKAALRQLKFQIGDFLSVSIY